ncbi:MAG: ABC transporter ATP-binding protein [Gemmatimonadetes bacterium]|nr:ABC transporter ATP-binding protein [Gemmatimonadota bacterium]
MSFPIHLANVSCRMGRDFALRDLTLKVPQGAIYGLLGPNGSGKTTTIRLIMGMLRAQDGTVVVAGHTMPDDAHLALSAVGYVPERPHLYAGLTVNATLAYHASFYATWDATRATQMLDAFDLRRSQVVGAMSKGETGKLQLLLALATRPSVLVLDEPTDGLDPVARRDVLSTLLEYVADTGATVLIASHLVHEIERVCDWVGLMEGGRLIQEEPLVAFRDSLRRLRVANAPATLGAVPFSMVARRTAGRGEEWVVRGHGADSEAWLSRSGIEVIEAAPLDLEETVVELLRATRRPRPTEVR